MVELKLRPRQVDILKVALKLLAEGGCHALTIRRIADELEISEPAIYRHFQSKKELLKALYSYVWSRLSSEVYPLARGDGDGADRLGKAIRGTLEFLHRNKGVTLVLLSEAIHHDDPELKDAMLSLVRRFQGIIREILEDGVDEGSFRNDLCVDLASQAVVGFLQSSAMLSLLRGVDCDAETCTSGFLDTMLKGIVER